VNLHTPLRRLFAALLAGLMGAQGAAVAAMPYSDCLPGGPSFSADAQSGHGPPALEAASDGDEDCSCTPCMQCHSAALVSSPAALPADFSNGIRAQADNGFAGRAPAPLRRPPRRDLP